MSANTKQVRFQERPVPDSAQFNLTVQVNRLALLMLNSVTSTHACAIATTTTKVKTTSTCQYSVDGVNLSKAATDNLWDPAGLTAVAPGSFQKYLLLLDSAGAASIVEGTQSTVNAASVVLPDIPDGKCIVGVVNVATNGSTTFTPGTTAFNAAGVTTTFADGLPKDYLPLLLDLWATAAPLNASP